jgi:hypothetical protein
VKQKLTDQFIQKWYNLIATSSRGNLYGQFKIEFKLENYLLKLSPNERALITKLRCCNLKIPVETGSWVNISIQTIQVVYRLLRKAVFV